MSLVLTLKPFDRPEELSKIPEMVFDSAQPEYWILLPFFEKVEEKTGKLIDVGDSVEFDHHECGDVQDVLNKELESLEKEVNEDTLLERDNEVLKKQLEMINLMLNLAIRFKTSFLALAK